MKTDTFTVRTFLLLALLLGSGCATPSLNIVDPLSITSAKVGRIREGATRATDLTPLFGKPEMVIPSEDGLTHFYKDNNLNSLWVLFAQDGTVADFEFSQ